jgi:integrase/recombinase XerC/integrase/recombinase XerD
MSDKRIPTPNGATSQDAFDLAAELFLTAKTAERCTVWTLRAYRRAVTRFVTWARGQGIAGPRDVTAAHVRAYFVHLADLGLKSSSIHDYARPLKTWLRFLFAENVLAADPMQRVKMPRQDDAILPAFTADDMRKLLDACQDTKDPERDTALVLALLDTGVRAAELCALTVGDVDTKTGAVTVRYGKGRKERVVFIGARAQRAWLKYLLTRGHTAPTDPMFPSRNTGAKLTPNGLRQFCSRLGERADVANCHPHTFRRSFAIESLRAGMNLFALQRLMGHSDLSILRKYLALVEHDLRAAHRDHGAVDRLLSDKTQKGG